MSKIFCYRLNACFLLGMVVGLMPNLGWANLNECEGKFNSSVRSERTTIERDLKTGIIHVKSSYSRISVSTIFGDQQVVLVSINKYGHVDLLVGNVRVDMSALLSPPIINSRTDLIDEGISIRLKGFSNEQIQRFKESVSNNAEMKGLTCIHACDRTMNRIFGLSLDRRAYWPLIGPGQLLTQLLEQKYVNSDGTPIDIDVVLFNQSSLDDVRRRFSYLNLGAYGLLGFNAFSATSLTYDFIHFLLNLIYR